MASVSAAAVTVAVAVSAPVIATVPPNGVSARLPLVVVTVGTLSDVAMVAVLLPVSVPVTATVPPALVNVRLPLAVVTVGVLTLVANAAVLLPVTAPVTPSVLLTVAAPVMATVPPVDVRLRLPLAVVTVGAITLVDAVTVGVINDVDARMEPVTSIS